MRARRVPVGRMGVTSGASAPTLPHVGDLLCEGLGVADAPVAERVRSGADDVEVSSVITPARPARNIS